ncbi:skin secretory protein xP2-like, partial [Branchiostoma floridae]|uniref:Skin secretory protein xP2-like n=1 Tax=Branchiostoma floridae TaxID=7739 RepID=A0A9J7HRI4_BRAFL
MADKGSTSAKGAGKAKRMKRGAETQEQGEATRPKQLRAEHPPVGEGGQGRGEESAQVQGPSLVPADPQIAQAPDQDEQQAPLPPHPAPQLPGPVEQQQAPLPPQPSQEGQGAPAPQPLESGDQQQAPLVPQPGQQEYGAPAPQPPTDQAPANAGQPPALQMSVGQVLDYFGGATIRIQDRALAAGGSVAGVVGAGLVTGVATAVTTLAAFYMDNKQKTEEAIRRAVERERHVQVQSIEKGSLLVRVNFLTLAGYWVIRSLNERIDRRSDRTCLQLLLEDEL